MIGDPIARFDAVATPLVLRNEQEIHRTHPSALAPPSRAKKPAAAPAVGRTRCSYDVDPPDPDLSRSSLRSFAPVSRRKGLVTTFRRNERP
ncbi:hypothetical protein ABIE78_002988 [Sinorhizobium fredii]